MIYCGCGGSVPPRSEMTTDDFGKGYERGYRRTVRFLTARGVRRDAAEETAQAAWVKGWERLNQLRSDTKLVNWVNSIALNVYRNVQRAPLLQVMPELSMPPQINLAAIDVDRIFRSCTGDDRWILRRRYLEDAGIDDLARQEGRTTGAIRLRLLRARRSAKAVLARAV